jgi:hypothetical protein
VSVPQENTPQAGVESNRLAEDLRSHYDKAIAETGWCQRHISELLQAGKISRGDEGRPLCGDHWKEMRKEWAEVARICRQSTEAVDLQPHPIARKVLAGIADKLDTWNQAPFQAIRNAHELISWLPADIISNQERKDRATETLFRLPILEPAAKVALLRQIQSKPGRPSETRRVAVYALELHNQDKTWSEIEGELVANRKNARKRGATIRREVQRLKNVLQRHGISSSS